MRILIHDFAGHPFQIQLSRELAARGHEVLHLYCASLSTTPQGSLTRRATDPASFQVRGVALDEPLHKDRFFKRWRQEREYGRRAVAVMREFRPDAVVSGNTPLDAQRMLITEARALSARFVFWVQDVIGVATKRILSGKSRLVAATVGSYYERLERKLLSSSDALVVITDDFRPLFDSWGVATETHVIENWAPLDELPAVAKDNDWARRHDLADKRTLVYTGTLGMKHNPQLLLDLAVSFRDEPDVRVVVTSQGAGAEWLRSRRTELGLDNLIIMGFQPFEDVPSVMGASDVLIAVLEPDAGVFSVPSKVLSYLTAARPLLLAVPQENLASKIVRDAGAGIVVDPGDSGSFVREAKELLQVPARREEMGLRARAYAENIFDVAAIADRFETVLAVADHEGVA